MSDNNPVVPVVDFSTVDTFIFDYGGVLAFHYCEPWQGNIAKLLNVTPKEARSLLSETSEWGRDYRLGNMSRDDFWRLIAKKTNSENVDFSALEENWAKSYQLDQRMLELVRFLRNEHHCKVGVLSNSDKYRHEYIERTYNLSNEFDYIVSSHLNGIVKPETSAYETALQIAQRTSAPETVVYIDDRERNIIPALGIGMKGYVFNDYDNFVTDLKTSGLSFAKRPQQTNGLPPSSHIVNKLG